MNLSAATLADLIRALRAYDQDMNKRKDPRVGLRTRTRLIPDGGGAEIPAQVRDVSAGGMNLLCGQPITEGDAVTIDLGPLDQARCVVRHCRKVAGALWAIGIKFEGYEPRERHKPEAPKKA